MKNIIGFARSRIGYAVWDFLYAESAERRSSMKTYTFNLRFRNGEKIKRTEWGRSRYDAVKTLMSIYGLLNKDFFICEEVVKA